MNDHDAPAPRPQDDLPPIPDGGLGKGLPSWLETPPSRPVKPAGEPTPIDPGALVAGMQLPQWLQDLSDRVTSDDVPGEQVAAVALEDDEDIAPVPVERPVEPVPEPSVVVAPPVEQPPSESRQPVTATPESRRIGMYLRYALVVIVIVALAAWLIWG